MRREYKQDQSYIDYLKQLGCVLYLPLTEGDLQDKISGEYMQLTGYGSMMWDSNEQMYLFSMPSPRSNSVLTLNTTIESAPSWSILCMAKKSSGQGNSNTASILTIGSFSQNINGTYGASKSITAGIGHWTQTGKFGYTMTYCANPMTRTFFVDGEQVRQDSLQESSVPTASSVNIGTIGAWGYPGRVYMSEVYLFNTVLDLATIRKIQGYDD